MSTSSAETSNAIEVRHSAVHGQGVFAVLALKRGSVIGRYAGRRYKADEVHQNECGVGVTYVFGLSDGSLIDGADGGNATRHINHSCAPNCVAYEIEGEDGELQVEIETLQRIPVGAELFIDYGLDVGDDDPADYQCRCGVKRCRGTLLAAEPG